jgi:hypothetical protein
MHTSDVLTSTLEIKQMDRAAQHHDLILGGCRTPWQHWGSGTRYCFESISQCLALKDLLAWYQGNVHFAWGEQEVTGTPQRAEPQPTQARADWYLYDLPNSDY